MTTHDTLAGALRSLLDAGRWPVCASDPDAWLSEDPDERAQAATWCESCELLDPCGAAGVDERFGVWGGQDRTRAPGRRPPARAATASRPNTRKESA